MNAWREWRDSDDNGFLMIILCPSPQSLEPPITSAGMNIKRWHPEFPLEDVPDVEVAPLPKPPQLDKLDTARDVLGELTSDYWLHSSILVLA